MFGVPRHGTASVSTGQRPCRRDGVRVDGTASVLTGRRPCRRDGVRVDGTASVSPGQRPSRLVRVRVAGTASVSTGQRPCRRDGVRVAGTASVSPGQRPCRRDSVRVAGTASVSPGQRPCRRDSVRVAGTASVSPGQRPCRRDSVRVDGTASLARCTRPPVLVRSTRRVERRFFVRGAGAALRRDSARALRGALRAQRVVTVPLKPAPSMSSVWSVPSPRTVNSSDPLRKPEPLPRTVRDDRRRGPRVVCHCESPRFFLPHPSGTERTGRVASAAWGSIRFTSRRARTSMRRS